jgi:lysine 2,3-aminomutase
MRALGIENHYLFHCVPIGGLNSLRPPLARAIELARQLSSTGRISGRAKPQFALLTDSGKITMYEGTILDHRDNKYLLRSNYSLQDRQSFNPSWKLPKTAVVAADGTLCVWYTDAVDEAAAVARPELVTLRGNGESRPVV